MGRNIGEVGASSKSARHGGPLGRVWPIEISLVALKLPHSFALHCYLRHVSILKGRTGAQ